MMKIFITLQFYLSKLFNKIRQITHLKNNKARNVSDKTVLDPLSIPKFTNQLLKPPVYKPYVLKKKVLYCGEIHIRKSHYYMVDMTEFKQQVLPEGYPKTKVWGYGGLIKDPKTGRVLYSRSAPGATFEAERGTPVIVKWINKLTKKHIFAVDPTLHWANPNNMSMMPPKPWPAFPPGFPKAQKPVPTVTHLHGGEVPSIYDGHPDAWETFDGKKGPAYVTSTFKYPNKQEATTLWYHDHALGITRLNVYAGLAGFYLLRDKACGCYNETCISKLNLPSGKYEIPLAIQDRSFYCDGSLLFNDVGINPEIHPYWVPEFFGNSIMVNGRVWPNLDVDRCQYRFRVLNGSNARFYNLMMSNGMKFIQIGSDGGFLPTPVELTSLLLAPGERADLLVDFSSCSLGTKITLINDANAPYPDGDAPDPSTTGLIMQFTIPEKSKPPVRPRKLPKKLNDIPELIPNSCHRILTLNEVMGPNGPEMVLLNGQKWSAPITEKPLVGSTEEWTIVNLTMDTHPIHLHLVQFQLFNRQNFNADEYMLMWEKINGMPPFENPPMELPVEPFLMGEPIPPADNEMGWKDTIRMNPNQVTRIRVRFAPQWVKTGEVCKGENLYPFDPSKGPGYVWHCHILDHEDNEMMRPYIVE